MTGFLLKKLISYWLMPLPVCLVLLTVGFCLLRWPRWQRSGRRLIGAALLLLLLVTNKTFSVWITQPLESAYPAIPELALGAPLPPDLARCRFVVVLGSGHSDNDHFSSVNKLCESAHARLLEAVRLLRLLPDAKLVTTGSSSTGAGRPSHAAVAVQAAVSLGFDPARAITVTDVLDTEDECAEVKKIVGDAPFVLVTSAWHMPRAMRLMHRAGLHPLAGPSDYGARQPAPTSWRDALWDVESLTRSTRAVHEAYGLAWTWLKSRG